MARRRLRIVFPLALTGLVVACAGVGSERVGELHWPAPAREPGPGERQAPAPVPEERTGERLAARDRVLEEVNGIRRRAGRRSLARNPRLERAAQRHAEDMVRRGFFDHANPDGQNPRARVEAAGYGRARIVGENLGRENLGLGPPAPEGMVERWLASAPHHDTLLDTRFSETGVGLALDRAGGRDEYYWVQLFAAPPR